MRARRKTFCKSIIITLLSFVTFSFLGGFFGINTENGRVDALTYQINDYNKHTINNDFVRPYIRIESKRKRNHLYDDLFQQFYYSDDSGSIRQLMENNCSFDGVDTQTSINLFSQSTFSILKKQDAEGGYRIDYGVFHAYFSEIELHGKTYIGRRFNCDSYIFISDTIADLLLEKYGLEKSMESYLKLITEEQYAVFYVTIDESRKLSFSINNIIYSNKRTAPRCSEFNQYFGLINHQYVANYLQPAFEIDFKAYSYYISSVLNKCERMGYNVDSFRYRFFEYDYNNKSYYEDMNINNEYLLIRSNDYTLYSAFFIAVFALSIIVFSLLVFLLLKSNYEFSIVFASMLGSLSVISIVANFIYVSYFISIVPLALFIILIITKGGIIYERIARSSKKQDLGKRTTFNIEI